MGVDSGALAERLASAPEQQGFFQSLYAATGGRLVPLPGGVLIRDADGEVLGALGVAGGPSQDDEACARAAIRAAGFHETGS